MMAFIMRHVMVTATVMVALDMVVRIVGVAMMMMMVVMTGLTMVMSEAQRGLRPPDAEQAVHDDHQDGHGAGHHGHYISARAGNSLARALQHPFPIVNSSHRQSGESRIIRLPGRVSAAPRCSACLQVIKGPAKWIEQ